MITLIYRIQIKGKFVDYEQLEITSDEWKNQPEQDEVQKNEFTIDLEDSDAQIWCETITKKEVLTTFKSELRYEVNDQTHRVAQFIFDDEKGSTSEPPEYNIYLYSFSKMRLLGLKRIFLNSSQQVMLTITVYSISLQKATAFLNRFCEWHDIERNDKSPIETHYIGDLPAYIIKYDQPDPLDDEPVTDNC